MQPKERKYGQGFRLRNTLGIGRTTANKRHTPEGRCQHLGRYYIRPGGQVLITVNLNTPPRPTWFEPRWPSGVNDGGKR